MEKNTPITSLDPYQRFLATKRFQSLDGLRFLSIIAVLWHHSGINYNVPLLHRGQFGVHLFFSISGFLITTLLIRERKKYGKISLKRFYARRSLRVFPLYYAVLVIYFFVVLIFEKNTSVKNDFFNNLLFYATYTNNWFVSSSHSNRIIFFFAWSLAVEEQFYLTWPWLERYLPRFTPLILLPVLFLIVALTHFGLLGNLVQGTFVYTLLWHIAPCILLGVLLAHVLHNRTVFSILYKMIGKTWAPLIILVLVFVLASVSEHSMLHQYYMYLLLTLLVGACIIREDHVLSPFLMLKPIARIGVVSYGIYLMHMLCFNISRVTITALGFESKWAIFLLGLVLVYIAAEISFNTFEKYFLNLKSRFAR